MTKRRRRPGPVKVTYADGKTELRKAGAFTPGRPKPQRKPRRKPKAKGSGIPSHVWFAQRELDAALDSRLDREPP